MKKIITYLFISAIFTTSVHSFNKDTPECVALFCQMIAIAEEVTKDMMEDFPDFNDFLELTAEQKLEKISQKYGKNHQKTYWFKKAQNELLRLKTQIINENLVLEVPYCFRGCFPEEFQVLRFEGCSPLQNFENKILAIGGTKTEVEILACHGFNQNEFCSINVMRSAKPNYLADMTTREHMVNFEGKFEVAFARAIPCSKELAQAALSNIALSLTKDGLFIANFQISAAIEEVETFLTNAGFLSFKIFAIDAETGSVKFIASRRNLSPEELETFINNDARLCTLKHYVFLEPEFDKNTSSSFFSWCNIL